MARLRRALRPGQPERHRRHRHRQGRTALDRRLRRALTARRRVEALAAGQAFRPATEIDLALLGAQTEALLWVAVRPGALEQTAQSLSTHPHVRFCAATAGPANLVVAVAAADLDALYGFLTDDVGALEAVTAIDVTPLLATVKRTGLIRH